MANPIKGEVTLEAGDEIYTLVLDFNAICEMEDAADRPSGEIFARLEKGFTSELGRILWAALRRNHPDVSLKDARDLIEAVGLEAAAQTIEKAVSVSSLVPKGNTPAGKPRKRTGSR